MTITLPKFKFYGRRKGKPMTAHRQGLLDNDDAYQAKLTMHPDPSEQNWLEIGFGNGEFLSHMCQNHADIKFIGCEPFLNGSAALYASLEKPVENLKIWKDDARLLMDTMPDTCLDRAYLLNPDPWPKSRHRKRRFVQPESLDELARLLKPGGLFIMSTDVEPLAHWMFKHSNAHDQFENTGLSGDDWTTPPADWPIDQTRYMKKGLAGNTIYWLIFKRK
jgi:tRNA (guanine-N7-)-methyltransferase